MYKFNYKIKKEDINYGGHVGNERALLFFQNARMSLFESMGSSEIDLGDGAGVIQKNANVEYNKQLFLDDDITVCITKCELEKISFTLYYEIMKGADKAITGSTKLVTYDYNLKKIKKVPSNFIDKIKEII